MGFFQIKNVFLHPSPNLGGEKVFFVVLHGKLGNDVGTGVPGKSFA